MPLRFQGILVIAVNSLDLYKNQSTLVERRQKLEDMIMILLRPW